jgi:hypothetical protein
MAAPNLLSLTTVTAKTFVQSVTTTATAMTGNLSGSNKVVKVSALYVSNVDGTNDATIDVDVFRSSTAYYIAKGITVPANSSLDVISKALYLEEGDSLRLTASVDGDLQAVCSTEEIS